MRPGINSCDDISWSSFEFTGRRIDIRLVVAFYLDIDLFNRAWCVAELVDHRKLSVNSSQLSLTDCA